MTPISAVCSSAAWPRRDSRPKACPTAAEHCNASPDADGRDLCQALRAQGVRAPVLFLTARDAVPDRISGFRAGGDDYVTKPFALAEVAERLRALLRRTAVDAKAESVGLRIDPSTHAARYLDGSMALTPTEFRLLGALAARPGETLRRLDPIKGASQ